MLNDAIIERIFSHKDTKSIPVGYQSAMITIMGEVLYEMKGENPYATISELLSDTDEYISKQLYE